MSECVVRVEKLTNGYTVEIPDAAVAKANKNPKTPYKDPWKEYAFATAEEAAKFVTDHLKSLEPVEDDYATNFSRATAED